MAILGVLIMLMMKSVGRAPPHEQSENKTFITSLCSEQSLINST